MLRTAVLLFAAALLASAVLAQRPRIVNGVEAQPYVYSKWLVALYQSGRLICGGFMVGPRTVVTAAHCVDPTRWPGIYTTQALRHDISNFAEQAIVMTAVKSWVHPRFNSTSYSHDVAVLEVDSAYSTAWPSLDDGSFSQEKIDPNWFTIAGWGSISNTGPGSTVLLEARVPQENQTICSTKFTLDSTQLCAGGLQSDTCYGDSGGPLWTNRGTTPVIVGITSNGVDCATPGYPGVYTRISQVRQWILDIMFTITGVKPTQGIPTTTTTTTRRLTTTTTSTQRMTTTTKRTTTTTKRTTTTTTKRPTTTTTTTKRTTTTTTTKRTTTTTTRRPTTTTANSSRSRKPYFPGWHSKPAKITTHVQTSTTGIKTTSTPNAY